MYHRGDGFSTGSLSWKQEIGPFLHWHCGLAKVQFPWGGRSSELRNSVESAYKLLGEPIPLVISLLRASITDQTTILSAPLTLERWPFAAAGLYSRSFLGSLVPD